MNKDCIFVEISGPGGGRPTDIIDKTLDPCFTTLGVEVENHTRAVLMLIPKGVKGKICRDIVGRPG